MLGSQRFGHENVTVKPVCQAKSSGHPERQTRTDVSERAANSRTENETETERDADHAESAGAFLFWNDVSDVGHGSWNARSSDSGNDPAEKKPTNRRRQRHHNVIEAETEIR